MGFIDNKVPRIIREAVSGFFPIIIIGKNITLCILTIIISDRYMAAERICKYRAIIRRMCGRMVVRENRPIAIPFSFKMLWDVAIPLITAHLLHGIRDAILIFVPERTEDNTIDT